METVGVVFLALQRIFQSIRACKMIKTSDCAICGAAAVDGLLYPNDRI